MIATTIWRKAAGPIYTAAIAIGVLDALFRIVSVGLEIVPKAAAAAVPDIVNLLLVATLCVVLAPVFVTLRPRLDALLAPAGRAFAHLPWSWAVFVLAALYFLVPLIATAVFSLRMRRDYLSFDAYASVLNDAEFHKTFTYSIVVSLATILVGLIITVPAAYLVRLRLQALRPFVEFVTLLPLIIPPIILVFAYIRTYNTSSFLPLTGSVMGTDTLLVLSYVALGLPYMYRAVDTGLRAIDVQTLTEAATIMGANQATILTRVIFPNILVAALSGAFLTFAIVIGEFTMASLLSRPAFGTYLQRIGISKSYEPAALSVISFVVTWGAMGMIQLLARFAPRTAAGTD